MCDAMLRFFVLIGTALVISAGFILFLDYLNHARHATIVNGYLEQSEERNRQGMIRLCKTYREWQRLPDLVDNNIESMESICKQYEGTDI
jgi:hypothetical protein